MSFPPSYLYRHEKVWFLNNLFIPSILLCIKKSVRSAFYVKIQIFSQKSCLKTYLFNTCLQLTRVKLLIYLINIRMRARGCVRAHTHRLHVWQVTRCMEHFSTRIFIFSNTDFIFWTRIARIKRIWLLEEYTCSGLYIR